MFGSLLRRFHVAGGGVARLLKGRAPPPKDLVVPVWRLVDKAQTGTVTLRGEVFGQPNVRNDILHTVVVWQRAKRRQAPAFAKTRAEVKGSGRKIYRQKGTGRARHGDRYAPIFVGGGKAHGPRPRSFAYQLPKRVRRLGLMHALSSKRLEGSLLVADSFAPSSLRPAGAETADDSFLKTKEVLHTLQQWGLCKHGPYNFPQPDPDADVTHVAPQWSAPVTSSQLVEAAGPQGIPENLALPEVLHGGKTTTNRVLLVGLKEELEGPLKLAVNNIPSVNCLPVEGVNVYSLLRTDVVIVSQAAVPALEERLTRPINRKGFLVPDYAHNAFPPSQHPASPSSPA